MRSVHRFTLRLFAAVCARMLPALVLLNAPAIRADVLFSSLPFNPNSTSSLIAGPSSRDGYDEFALQFTPSETATLDSIQIPFVHFEGGNNAVTIALYTSLNSAPDVALASQEIPANTITFPGTLQTINFGGSVLLVAGTPYFVDAATTGNARDGWLFNSSSTYYPGAVRFSPNAAFIAIPTNAFSLALQVNGTPTAVPEPGSIALLTGMTLTGAAFLRRRKQASKAA